jgi:hypothetical protein
LPVGTKPLVAHTLDALAAAGIERATLVVHERDLEAVRSALSADELPLALEYYARAEESEGPDTVVRALQPNLTEELLVVRGDVLRSGCIGEFLARAAAFPGAYTLAATIGGVPAGLRLVRAGAIHPLGLAREPEAGWHEGPPRIELPGAALALLTSPAEYHQVLLDAVRGRYSWLKLGGRRAAEGVTLERGARLPADVVCETPVHVGRGAQVAHGVELMGGVLIGAGSRVETGARLRATVLMPGSVVPAGTRLENALVCGSDALMLNTDTVVALRQAPQQSWSLAPLAERLLAWAAFVVVLPLWPLALLAGLVAEHSHEDRQPDALHWLAGLVHVRELQPAMWRPAHVSISPLRPRA